MKCQNCGTDIMNGAQFCPNCGSNQFSQDAAQTSYQNQSYQQPYQQSYQQPYQQPYQQSYQQPYQQGYQNQPGSYGQQPYGQQMPQNPYGNSISYQDAEVWMKIISFFIPIVGIIMYFVKKPQYPVYAKSCLTWGLIGIAVNFFFWLIF